MLDHVSIGVHDVARARRFCDPVPADDRSGLHFSFTASGRKAVDAFHAAALAAGGADNGKPGPRPDYGPNYYAAFVKDLDGYRIEAHAEIAV